jgi:hypothetical protein
MRVEMKRGARRSEGNERDGAGEEWGVLLGGFYRTGRRGGGRSRESNGSGRWCSLKALISRNQRAMGGEMVRRPFQERRCRGRASLMGQRSALRSAATARIGSGSWRWKKG